ncbi:PREDICTED: interleukin-6-like [Chinchilla lanigera]|uniref:interleukin-6-like n=1 Tax=Chinchilla lanigera TaxID=34839 RepID=UPI00038EEC2F|nr:PREDICTED: interleukin-6-like [Chinchilla lanigera]
MLLWYLYKRGTKGSNTLTPGRVIKFLFRSTFTLVAFLEMLLVMPTLFHVSEDQRGNFRADTTPNKPTDLVEVRQELCKSYGNCVSNKALSRNNLTSEDNCLLRISSRFLELQFYVEYMQKTFHNTTANDKAEDLSAADPER